ncbi:unnamed protein product [Ixodes pacificus]
MLRRVERRVRRHLASRDPGVGGLDEHGPGAAVSTARSPVHAARAAHGLFAHGFPVAHRPRAGVRRHTVTAVQHLGAVTTRRSATVHIAWRESCPGWDMVCTFPAHEH